MATASNFDDCLAIVLTGDVTAGTFAVHQGVFGMYMQDGKSGNTVAFKIKGRINGVTKKGATGLTWTAGQRLYFDNTTEQQFQTNATGGVTIAQNVVAAAAATATATTGDIILL